MSNLDLWKSVEKTDPSFTKHVKARGGYTSIDATYQAMKATEQFGIYGKGWGLESIEYDSTLLDKTNMIICRAVFFYTIKGDRFSFPLCNAISPMNGSKADEDFCKKLETNTISKALSKLGFSADVFMGKFENEDYLSNLKIESSIEKANNKDEEVNNQQQELIDYVKRNKTAIAGAASPSMAKGLCTVAIKHLNNKTKILILNDIAQKGITALNEEYKKFMENQK